MCAMRVLRDFVLTGTHHGRAPRSRLPMPPTPFRMGGLNFRSDPDFLAGADADVDQLVEYAGLNTDSSLLDWGCGAGRLAVGIAERFGRINRYHGVDVQPHLITWARRHLAREGFEFTLSGVANERYNPTGCGERRIPAAGSAYDIAYAYSVYSHMRADETADYLAEFRRVLKPGGIGFLTAFVGDGVPDETVNPTGWGSMAWSGPLHCVLYRREFFEHLIERAGLLVKDRKPGVATDGQSIYLVGVA